MVRLRMAVVVAQEGSFGGTVTVEDIVEEIVGEIRDESDGEGAPVRELPDGSHSVDGLTAIDEANRGLGSEFESEDFGTVGGLVFGRLGRAPRLGDEVRLGGYVLRVEEVDGSRVARVVARKAPPQEPA